MEYGSYLTIQQYSRNDTHVGWSPCWSNRLGEFKDILIRFPLAILNFTDYHSYLVVPEKFFYQSAGGGSAQHDFWGSIHQDRLELQNSQVSEIGSPILPDPIEGDIEFVAQVPLKRVGLSEPLRLTPVIPICWET